MDRARQRAILVGLLAPQRQSRFATGIHAVVILVGLATAVGLGLGAGKPHMVLNGCALVLLGQGGVLRMWNGMAGLAVMALGMLLMSAALVAVATKPWRFQWGAGLLLAYCVIIPFVIWNWNRILRS